MVLCRWLGLNHDSGARNLPDLLEYFLYCSSNPIYAGAYRGYDIAAILDKNLPKSLATDHGKCDRSAGGSSIDCAGTGNSMIRKWAK